MKHEAITVCIGEVALKFLKITLPQNIKFFDNYIVITDSKDLATQEYCKDFSTTILITESFYSNGAIFNKGAVYNEAFQILKFKDWISILDCDIFIPDKLGASLLKKDFDTEYMYGCRRIVAPKFYDFNLLFNTGNGYEDNLWTPFGIGYGFHQMFNYNSESFKKCNYSYPHSYERYAANGDWQFRNIWGETINGDTEYTKLLKEIPERCWHLGEPNMDGGKNFFLAN